MALYHVDLKNHTFTVWYSLTEMCQQNGQWKYRHRQQASFTWLRRALYEMSVDGKKHTYNEFCNFVVLHTEMLPAVKKLCERKNVPLDYVSKGEAETICRAAVEERSKNVKLPALTKELLAR